jgi:hypothetical protein
MGCWCSAGALEARARSGFARAETAAKPTNQTHDRLQFLRRIAVQRRGEGGQRER